MITTVTMNPCIDRTVAVEEFIYGGMNRIQESRSDASGKGVNVAIVYQNIGGSSYCTGFNYTQKGDLIEKRLGDLGIPCDFVEVQGEVRTNLKIFDRSNRVITEVNESGHPVPMDKIGELVDKVILSAKRSSVVVFSGSVPRSVSNTIYRQLLESIKGCGVRTILDAEGTLLLEGIKASPYLIKPNLFELEDALGMSINTHRDIIKAARTFLDQGISVVGVSMGAEGAVIVDDRKAYYAPPVPIEVKSTVGAGDSMVAAFCRAIEMKMGLDDMLRYGTAAAAATVSMEGTQLCTGEIFHEMLTRVKIEVISE